MRKLVLASMLAAVSAPALADVHFDFGVPFQVTKKTEIGNLSGYSTSLMVDLDSSTSVGIYGEEQTYQDRSGAAAVAGKMTVSAFRFQKTVMENVSVGLNMGEISNTSATAANSGNGNLADIFGKVMLASSKGKVNSYLSTELKYRMAKSTGVAANDFSGIQLLLGAGLNF